MGTARHSSAINSLLNLSHVSDARLMLKYRVTRTLEPKSRYESGTSTPTSSSHAGSVNSLVDPGQSTLRKKKPAPKPPTIIKDDASNSSITSSPTPSTVSTELLFVMTMIDGGDL